MNAIIIDDDPIVQATILEYSGKTKILNLTKIFSNPTAASDYIMNEKVDLMFLDVLMPEITGIELLESLNGNSPQVIMISTNEKFAKDGFNFNVTDFILKPVSYPRFLKAVAKAKKIYDSDSNTSANENIFVKVNSRLKKIEAKDILLVEAMADYVAVHTETQRYIIHSTMKAIEDKLSSAEFARIHNSYIIRLDRITEIEDNTLVVNKKLIPISKSHRKDLMNRLKLL